MGKSSATEKIRLIKRQGVGKLFAQLRDDV